jgi:hypothetical protein
MLLTRISGYPEHLIKESSSQSSMSHVELLRGVIGGEVSFLVSVITLADRQM